MSTDSNAFTENVPLVYNDSLNTSSITNILLIDDTVYQADIFYNAVSPT